MKLTALKTDLGKTEAGVWIGDIPDMGGVRLKVRPISNPDYRQLYGRLVDATPRHLKRGGQVVDYQTKADIAGRCLADTVLLDWEGIEGDDGKPLEYDPELAKQYLINPEYAAFRDAVSWAANVAEEEARADFEGKSGN